MAARCLVLGANGFIGSHLVDSLVKRGHFVRAFDRFSGPVQFEETSNVELFPGDFLNMGDLELALQGVDYVFHFISTTTPATAENDPLIDIETNVKMSVRLFHECSRAGVKKVIFASTGGAIYGGNSMVPRSEDDLTQPVSPYAIGKLSIENYLRYFRVKFELDSIVLRISNPYGERQPFHRKQGVIPIFLENICRGEDLVVYGDGTMVRDYIYVKDVSEIAADIFLRKTENNVYNIGTGKGVSINELLAAIRDVSGWEPKIVNRDVPPTFVKEIVLNTNRYNNEFGRVAYTSLQDGINATYTYIQHEIRRQNDEE